MTIIERYNQIRDRETQSKREKEARNDKERNKRNREMCKKAFTKRGKMS